MLHHQSHHRHHTAVPPAPPAAAHLPLPKHIDEQLVLGAISVSKDVDGFHPLNIGRLCMKVGVNTGYGEASGSCAMHMRLSVNKGYEGGCEHRVWGMLGGSRLDELCT